jgi:phospholipase C
MKRFNSKTHIGTQKILTIIFTSLFATSLLTACGGSTITNQAGDIHKIKHVVVIMQENRKVTLE